MKEKKSGIYAIINKINGKKYIGQSLDIEYRLSIHKSRLLCGRHHSSHLQASFNKYGIDSFLFTELEIVGPERIDEREIALIDLHKTMNPEFGYNGDSGGHERHRQSEAVRMKMSLAKLGKKRGPHSEEHKRRISESSKKRTFTKEQIAALHAGSLKYHKGRKKPDHIIKNLLLASKLANTGKPLSSAHKEKISIANKGRKVSDIQKEQIRKALTGRKRPEMVEWWKNRRKTLAENKS